MSRARNRSHFGLSRRSFLQGLGASAVLSPFLPLWNASGQETLNPKRLILFWTPHGTVRQNWLPMGSGSMFTLSPILKPLQNQKQKIIVLDGLQIEPGMSTASPHSVTFPVVWTGAPLLEARNAECTAFGWGASVDQVVANRIGKNTAYKSLELGVQAGGTCPGSRMIFSGPNAPIAPSEDPWAEYDRLFSVPRDTTSLDRLRAERKSSIDLVTGELSALGKRAPKAEQAKIDAHLTALRSIEKRLSLDTAACNPPTLGARFDTGKGENMTKAVDLQTDIMVAAMSCDLTRVASMQVTKGDNDGQTYGFLGLTEGHHDISHKGDSDPSAAQDLTKIYTYYAERFAYLLEKLDSVQEGSGTMLDNSLVVWGSEIGKGNNHSYTSVPFVLAGGAAGAIKPGRFMTSEGTYHNRLLVAICNAMGLDDIESFGNPDMGKGPLSGLLV